MALETSGVAITTDLVKAKILQDVKKEDGIKALCAQPKCCKRRRRRRRKPKFCSNCGEQGHSASNCPSLHNTNREESCWLFDSGATQHMTNSTEDFVITRKHSHSIQIADDSEMKSIAKGNVKLYGKEDTVTVYDALLVPDLTMNLLSVSKICNRGHEVLFNARSCTVMNKEGAIIATGKQKNGLYIFEKLQNQAMMSKVSTTGRSNYAVATLSIEIPEVPPTQSNRRRRRQRNRKKNNSVQNPSSRLHEHVEPVEFAVKDVTIAKTQLSPKPDSRSIQSRQQSRGRGVVFADQLLQFKGSQNMSF